MLCDLLECKDARPLRTIICKSNVECELLLLYSKLVATVAAAMTVCTGSTSSDGTPLCRGWVATAASAITVRAAADLVAGILGSGKRARGTEEGIPLLVEMDGPN